MKHLQRAALCLVPAVCLLAACEPSPNNAIALMDLSAPQLAAEIAAGRVTAQAATQAALDRIAELDDAGPALNSIIEINPEALDIARELDERFADGAVGPLHGVPVVIKANIDTADQLHTSAGSLALAEHRADTDAPLVANLRAAGAVIVAKTNLSEWANFRGEDSSSGWSSLGGQTRNPWVLDRTPCGSSSGSAVAVAARIVPLAVGTETDGSIVCPSAVNGIVGIKPTIGSVSQQGIIPISASQDIAGPMARTVRGAAIMLSVLQGDAHAADAVARAEQADLSGVRIGVLRDYRGAGELPELEAQFAQSLATLEAAGAMLINPIELGFSQELRDAEFEVLLYEFKAGIDAYLANTNTGIENLADLIEFNTANSAEVMPHFGQELFEWAQQRDDLDDAAYLNALDISAQFRDSLADAFAARELAAIVAPVTGPAWQIDWENGDVFSAGSSSVAAISGFPSIAVPAGLTNGLPLSIAFIGMPDSEPALIEMAAAFEARRGEFPEPQFIDSINQD